MKVTLKPPHSAMLGNGGAGSDFELKTRFPFRRRRRPAEAGVSAATKISMMAAIIQRVPVVAQAMPSAPICGNPPACDQRQVGEDVDHNAHIHDDGDQQRAAQRLQIIEQACEIIWPIRP